LDFEFSKFLESVKHLDWLELDQAADRKKRELEKFKNGQPHWHAACRLAEQIRGLRFWMATNGRPGGMSPEDFGLLRPICQKFVHEGVLNPEALDLFGACAERGNETNRIG
jgi:hypothetical protein